MFGLLLCVGLRGDGGIEIGDQVFAGVLTEVLHALPLAVDLDEQAVAATQHVAHDARGAYALGRVR
jgi:hypothetical protein